MGSDLDPEVEVDQFQTVQATVRPGTEPREFAQQARDIALDVINQAGLQHLDALLVPEDEEPG